MFFRTTDLDFIQAHQNQTRSSKINLLSEYKKKHGNKFREMLSNSESLSYNFLYECQHISVTPQISKWHSISVPGLTEAAAVEIQQITDSLCIHKDFHISLHEEIQWYEICTVWMLHYWCTCSEHS